MERTSPILSICLMTYNQPEATLRFLKSISAQITSEVELVIKDDSSNDETEKIVNEFKKKIPIRYFHGEKKGIDYAVIFLTENARGKYIWWFGNDVMREGAIGEISNILKKNSEISFLLANYQAYNNSEPAYLQKNDFFFKNRNEVLEFAVGNLGFITVTIFEREKAITGIEKSKKYLKSAFVNLYLVLHVLSQEGKLYFLSTPYIENYPNLPDEVNPNGFEVFGVNLFNIVSEFRGKFSRRSMRKMLAKNFSYVWRGVLVRWVTGYESPKGIRWQMFKIYWSFPEFWLAFPALISPLWLNKLFYQIYKIFFSERKFKFLSK